MVVNAKQVHCFTGKDGRIESGQPVVAAFTASEGDEEDPSRHASAWHVTRSYGTAAIVDANRPGASPYVICFANGCMSDDDSPPELLANPKKGQNLRSRPSTQRRAAHASAGRFAKACDGPPTDPEGIRRDPEEAAGRSAETRRGSSQEAEANRASPAGALRANPGREVRQGLAVRVEKGAQTGAPFFSRSRKQRLFNSATDCAGDNPRTCFTKHFGDLRMPNRFAGIVGQQVLFGNIGDVFRF